MKILVLCDLDEAPVDQNFDEELKQELWKTEASVVRALKRLGHKPLLFGLANELSQLDEQLRVFRPDVIFNLCEAFSGDRALEPHIAAYLELTGWAYTGAEMRSLSIAKDKALSKRVVMSARIRVPKFEVVWPGLAARRFSDIGFPAFVKPLSLDSSQGISIASLVTNEKALQKRVAWIHRKYEQPALVEQYIDAREFYVGVLGMPHHALEIGRPRELDFGSVKPGARFASYSAKWDDSYRARWSVRTVEPSDLEESVSKHIRKVCGQIYLALGLSGYARIDVRVDDAGEVVFIEANPNPALGIYDDFARSMSKSAHVSQRDYDLLIDKIVTQALARNSMRPQPNRANTNFEAFVRHLEPLS